MIIVNIMADIVSKMSLKTRFDAGKGWNIASGLFEFDGAIASAGDKYPVIALLMPFSEMKGYNAYDATVIFPKIIIATLGRSDNRIIDRYNGGTFDQILQPRYEEFMNQLALSPYIVGMDWRNFQHNKSDNPGNYPITEGMIDVVDVIEIHGLKLTFTDIKTCK